MIPKKMFLTRGHGTHRHRLQSFELALRKAGIASCNLVNVSSIVPPHCELITKEKGISLLHPGEITYCVLSEVQTKQPSPICASIGVAIPNSSDEYGYIAECHETDISELALKRNVEDLAILMLATTKGMAAKRSPGEKPWSDEEIVQRFKDQMKTESVAEILDHTNSNLWSTVVAVAVFIE